jgi:LssY C-terminus
MRGIGRPESDRRVQGIWPRQRLVRSGLALMAGLAVYALAAYLIIPALWRLEIIRHPALQGAPRLTHTAAGIPGDPLNIALVATARELVRAMLGAAWHPADPITLDTSLRMVGGVVFRRPYAEAPVSHLYLWGRPEDLAFEQAVGDEPERRHHVRFWRSGEGDETGRPLWIGAATYDAGVGFSHTTGQLTHHIAPDVDAERDKIIADLRRADQLSQVLWIEQFHQVLRGYNGGGDPYDTDGRLAVGVIVSSSEPTR